MKIILTIETFDNGFFDMLGDILREVEYIIKSTDNALESVSLDAVLETEEPHYISSFYTLDTLRNLSKEIEYTFGWLTLDAMEVLKNEDIYCIGDLVQKSEEEIVKIMAPLRGDFINLLKGAIQGMGFKFGMTITGTYVASDFLEEC